MSKLLELFKIRKEIARLQKQIREEISEDIILENIKRVEKGESLTIPLSILDGIFKREYNKKKKHRKGNEKKQEIKISKEDYKEWKKRCKLKWLLKKKRNKLKELLNREEELLKKSKWEKERLAGFGLFILELFLTWR